MKKILVRLKDDTVYAMTKDYVWLNIDELNDTRKPFVNIEDLYVSKEEIKTIEVYEIKEETEINDKER